MRATGAILAAAALGWASGSPRNSPRHESHSMFPRASIISGILDTIIDGATCSGCEAVVLPSLKFLAGLGDDWFIWPLVEICKGVSKEDDDVCEGAIRLEGPIIARALREMEIPSHTAKLFCVTFLGTCAYPPVTPYQVPFPSGKPSAAASRPRTSGKSPLKVVHYSDIHIDPLYVPGSSANCSKPICCRPYTKNDQPGSSQSPAGPHGDHKCDTPRSLADSMYSAIESLVPDAAFSIFTGDIVDHAVWNTTRPYNEVQISEAYRQMGRSLGLVYGTAGNHEAHPTNAFQPENIGSVSQWIYTTLSESWMQWIGPVAAGEAVKRGVYSSRYPGGNLRIISLNTNMYYTQNYWLYQKGMARDVNGQFAWLVTELDAAEKAGERVYIIGHMPVGVKDAFHDQSNYLDQIINRYSDTIAAMFWGHTHVDHFQISYSNYTNRRADTASAMSYIGPSLTPTSGMPSFRVYDVDPETFAVLDATTYIADMNDPAYQTTGPVWKKYYSAKEAYGPLVEPAVTAPEAELTPAFWHKVTQVFETNSSTYQQYISRKSRGWKPDECMEDECKQDEICYLRAGRSQDNCYMPKLGVNFEKRSEDPVGNADECGISVTAATLGALAVERGALHILKRGLDEGLAHQLLLDEEAITN